MKKIITTILPIVVFSVLYFLHSQQGFTSTVFAKIGNACTPLSGGCDSGEICASEKQTPPYDYKCHPAISGPIQIIGPAGNPEGQACSINSLCPDGYYCTLEQGSTSYKCAKNPSNGVIIGATPSPTPPSSPCAADGWKDGICTKVPTSLFQGGSGSDGSISTDPAEFIVRIFAIVLGFAGGIALLLIISAGYKIMTSRGNPEKIQAGREQLISAIVGLVFIIFSFVIFQLVVVDILKIPDVGQ